MCHVMLKQVLSGITFSRAPKDLSMMYQVNVVYFWRGCNDMEVSLHPFWHVHGDTQISRLLRRDVSEGQGHVESFHICNSVMYYMYHNPHLPGTSGGNIV